MAILFNNAGGNQDGWLEALSQYLPNMPLHLFPHDKPEEIKYAVIWNHPAGDLKRYPNLRAILNLGAGTDYLELDQELPPVPVVRLVSIDANKVIKIGRALIDHKHPNFVLVCSV